MKTLIRAILVLAIVGLAGVAVGQVHAWLDAIGAIVPDEDARPAYRPLPPCTTLPEPATFTPPEGSKYVGAQPEKG